jgi:hypothetical protein
MSVSPEEFFMYLIIVLVIAIPASARLYRYVTAKRTAQMLEEQFGGPPPGDASTKG